MPVAPTIGHQPTDGSIELSASMTSIWVTGSASAPPSAAGSFKVHKPEEDSAFTSGAGRVACVSASTECLSTTSRMRSRLDRRAAFFSLHGPKDTAVASPSLAKIVPGRPSDLDARVANRTRLIRPGGLTMRFQRLGYWVVFLEATFLTTSKLSRNSVAQPFFAALDDLENR
jgi:hypothetical protein